LIWKRWIQVSSPDGWALLRANIASHSDAGGTGIQRLEQLAQVVALRLD